MVLKEGLWCRVCRVRVPLVEAGQHDLDYHTPNPHDRDWPTFFAGSNTSPEQRPPNRLGYKIDAVTIDISGRRDLHEPESLAGGIRNRPWREPSP